MLVCLTVKSPQAGTKGNAQWLQRSQSGNAIAMFSVVLGKQLECKPPQPDDILPESRVVTCEYHGDMGVQTQSRHLASFGVHFFGNEF